MKRKSPKKESSEKRKVAAYIRVSTTRQKMEGDSLEAQKNAITHYVESHLGLKSQNGAQR